MAGLRKQNQTAHGLPFLLVLSSDHTTPATGLSPTVTLSKNGGAFASCAGAVTEIANGWYKVAGNAADAGTLGPLLLHATAATADPTDSEFQVVAFDPDDAVRLGLTALPNTAPATLGGLPTTDANNAVYALQNFDFTVDTNPNTAETTILNALDDLHVTVVDIDPDALAAIAAAGGGSGASAADVWAYTTRTLTSGGTGGTVVITPILATTTNPRFSTRDLPPIAAGSEQSDAWTITDATGAAVDLSGKTIRLVAYTVDAAGKLTTTDPFDDVLTAAFKYETGDGIVVSGDDDNVVTVTHDAAKTAVPGDYRYFLWNVTDLIVLARGRLPIIPAVLDT